MQPLPHPHLARHSPSALSPHLTPHPCSHPIPCRPVPHEATQGAPLAAGRHCWVSTRPASPLFLHFVSHAPHPHPHLHSPYLLLPFSLFLFHFLSLSVVAVALVWMRVASRGAPFSPPCSSTLGRRRRQRQRGGVQVVLLPLGLPVPGVAVGQGRGRGQLGGVWAQPLSQGPPVYQQQQARVGRQLVPPQPQPQQLA